MRRDPSAAVVAWVRAQPPTHICTTAVAVAEIRYGIARLPQGKRQAGLRAVADEVFSSFADLILAFDGAAACHYADVVMERERAGAPISGPDAQIAAICRLHGVALATRNTRDFDRLDIDLVNPWQRVG